MNRPSAAAAGRQEQLAHGRGHLARVVAADVGDHEGAGVGWHSRTARPAAGSSAGPAGAPRRCASRPGRRGRPASESARVALVTSTPCAGAMHRVRQRLGRVDPVAAAGGVDHPAVEEGGVEPVDEVRVVLGVLVDGPQHRAPGRQRHPRAAVEAPQRAFDPRPVAGGERRRPPRRARPPAAGPAPAAAPRPWPSASAAARAVSRTRSSAGRAAHSMPDLGGRGAGAQLLQHRHQEGLDRPDRIDLAVGRRDAAGPALARQGGGGARAPRPAPPGVLAVAQHLHQPRLQARARAGRAPPARGSSGAARRPPRPTARRKRRCRRRRTGGGPRRRRCASARVVSPSAFEPRAARAPSKAAWVSTRAWLAMTMSARREPRIAFSMKQVR